MKVRVSADPGALGGLAGVLAPGLFGASAYAFATMISKREKTMSKPDKMFLTVVRVLSEEIDRLRDVIDVAKGTSDGYRESMDRLVADLRRERNEALDEVGRLKVRVGVQAAESEAKRPRKK